MRVLSVDAIVTYCDAAQRRRIAAELLVLGVLSSGFLVLFPRRPVLVDLGLALFAVSLVLLTADYTRTQIWGEWPVDAGRASRRRCLVITIALTVLVMVVFLCIGAVIGYEGADWPGVRARILHPYIPTAVLLYLPWALLQQTLFQFYLLGRVRALCPLLPPLAPSALNGLIFGLVHATDIRIITLAALGGTLWSFLYCYYRRLWPLAVSHALIGTTFYYWVYGSDLASRWRALLISLIHDMTQLFGSTPH
ncbi:CPBP family glutamic-type intramembrane protease [Nitrospira sp. Nam80]